MTKSAHKERRIPDWRGPACSHPSRLRGHDPQGAYSQAIVTLPSRDETRERSADHRCGARPVVTCGPVPQRHEALSVRLSDPEAGMHSYHRASPPRGIWSSSPARQRWHL